MLFLSLHIFIYSDGFWPGRGPAPCWFASAASLVQRSSTWLHSLHPAGVLTSVKKNRWTLVSTTMNACMPMCASFSLSSRALPSEIWGKNRLPPHGSYRRQALFHFFDSFQSSSFGLSILQQRPNIEHVVKVCLNLNLQPVTLCVLQSLRWDRQTN